MSQGERSSDLTQIAVNPNTLPDVKLDCGIRSLGWCSGANCVKFARLRVFLAVLVCAGILQGSCETYFRVSAKQAALENGYSPLLTEWLIVASGLFQAIFALAYAHFAYKFHPISCLGGSIMLQGAVCIIAVIPAIMNFSDGVIPEVQIDKSIICATTQAQFQRTMLSQQQSGTITLVLMFVLQFFLGLGSLAFYCIGIVYVDDNSQSIDSPAVIATSLAARLVGLQVGAFLVMGVGAASVGWWLGWAILAPLVFTTGLLLSLFPKSLPKTILHETAQHIIEETRFRQFGNHFYSYIDDTKFTASVKRLFGNKLLMFNILSIMFIHSAYVNYNSQEERYLQSRFYLPFDEKDGLMQEWKARFVSYFLRPPVAAVSMLIGGLIIAKLQLSGRKITSINIGLGIKLILIFIGLIFIKCDTGPVAGLVGGKLTTPFCSRQCLCDTTTFLPVCPENTTVTYFSPCFAGCSGKTTINNIELYEGCSCGEDFTNDFQYKIRATEGSCSALTCSKMLLAFQILSLSAATVYGMTYIGKIIITLRSVLPQDKALALAMEVMIFGLFAYIPAHLSYDVVTRTTCAYWNQDYNKCLMNESPKYGNILNIISAVLVLFGIIFDILVYIYCKGLNLYHCKVSDTDYTPSLYAPVPNEDNDVQPTMAASLHSNPTVITTLDGSPASLQTESPMQRRSVQTRDQIRKANDDNAKKHIPNNEITVFRHPSSLTSSSNGDTNSLIDPQTGVTYAQIVFPPDKRKPDDGTSSPKRMAVRADVPLHHLSAQDVRAQLSNLKSFNAQTKDSSEIEETSMEPAKKILPIETDLDSSIRPQSPETDL